MRILLILGILVFTAMILAGASTVAAADAPYEVWVPNQADDQVNIYSSDKFQVLATIDVDAGGFAKGSKPHLVAFSPSGEYAYITNVGAKADTNNVTVIRAADRKVVAQIPTALSAHATAFSNDGSRVWVYNTAANLITEVLANEAAEKWTVARSIHLGIRPVLGAFTPDNTHSFVTLGGNADTLGGIAIVDVATGKVVEQIETGREAVGVLLSKDKKRLYADVGFHAKNPVEMNDRLYVFNPLDRSLIRSIKLDGIKDSHLMTETPDGKELWIVNRQSNTISILDALTGAHKSTITVGDRPDTIAFSPDGKSVFWTLRGQPQTGDPFALKGNSPGVEVYDTAARKFVAFIPMPNGDPHGLAVYTPTAAASPAPHSGTECVSQSSPGLFAAVALLLPLLGAVMLRSAWK
jgi:YVTN family beta-propeller protein